MRRLFWIAFLCCLALPAGAESTCKAAERLVEESAYGLAVQAIDTCLETTSLTQDDEQWFLQARGYAHTKLGDNEAALADFDSAVVLGSPDAWLLITRSIVLASLGRSQKAWDDLDRAAALYPRDPEVFRARGVRFMEEGRLGYAHVALDKAIRLNPRLAASYASRGKLYMEEWDIEAAIEDFEQALAIDPELAQTYLDRGTCYNIIRRYGEAVADFGEALSRGIDDSTAYRGRAVALFALGEVDAALADLETLIARNPSDPLEYATASEILLDAKAALDRALSYSEMSVVLEPGVWWTHSIHADALNAMGLTQAAFEAYETVVAMASSVTLFTYEWMLAFRGYDPGDIDGVWTAASQSALEDCLLRDGCSLRFSGQFQRLQLALQRPVSIELVARIRFVRGQR